MYCTPDGLKLDRYGLPPTARFSHATMLRIAGDLDADFVIFGKFNSDGKSLTVETRVMRVSPTSYRRIHEWSA